LGLSAEFFCWQGSMTIEQISDSESCPLSTPSGEQSPRLDSDNLDFQHSCAAYVPASVRVHVFLPCRSSKADIEIKAGDANKCSDGTAFNMQPKASDTLSPDASPSPLQTSLWPISSYNTDIDIDGHIISSVPLDEILRSKSVKSVGFACSETHSVHQSEHSVEPYSEIYGQHPREFVFGSHGQRLPTPPPMASAELIQQQWLIQQEQFIQQKRNRLRFRAVSCMFRRHCK